MGIVTKEITHYTLVCDECGQEAGSYVSESHLQTLAIKRAREGNWCVTKQGTVICDDCQKRE